LFQFFRDLDLLFLFLLQFIAGILLKNCAPCWVEHHIKGSLALGLALGPSARRKGRGRYFTRKSRRRSTAFCKSPREMDTYHFHDFPIIKSNVGFPSKYSVPQEYVSTPIWYLIMLNSISFSCLKKNKTINASSVSTKQS